MKTQKTLSKRLSIILFALILIIINSIIVSPIYGQVIRTEDIIKKMLVHYPGGISCIASTDDVLLVARETHKQVLILNVETGDILGLLNCHTKPIEVMAASPMAGLAATVDQKRKEIFFWDISTGQSIKSFKNKRKIKSLAFSPDGKKLAIGENKGTISIFDISSWKVTRKLSIGKEDIAGILLELPKGEFDKIEFSPLGRYLTAQNGESIFIWDLVEKNPVNIHCGIDVPPSKFVSGYYKDSQFTHDEKYLLMSGGYKQYIFDEEWILYVYEMRGYLFLKNMNSGEVDTMFTSMPISSTLFTESDTKVFLEVFIPPSPGTLPFPNLKGSYRLLVYPIESILNGQLSGNIPAVELATTAWIYFKNKSIFVDFLHDTLYSWKFDENRPVYDEGIPIESIIQSE